NIATCLFILGLSFSRWLSKNPSSISICPSNLYLSSRLPMQTRSLCIINHIGSYLLCPSCRCISKAEKLFLVALIKPITIIQSWYGILLPCITVPLFKVVLNPQPLHSYCHLSCFQ